MAAMVCICNGVIRSGSTWSYNVCRGLMQELGRQMRRPSGSSYLELPQLEQFLIYQLPTIPGPTTIKAHEIGPAAATAIRTGVAKCVCTFRDPRDCVASDLIFFNQGLKASVDRAAYTFNFLQQFEGSDHLLLVRYERIMDNGRLEIARIAEHLGIDLDPSVIRRIHEQNSFEATQKVVDNLKQRTDGQVVHLAGHRVDPVTHVHENHLNGGLIGRWKTELSPEIGRDLSRVFAPWLLKLGYETQESLAAMVG